MRVVKGRKLHYKKKETLNEMFWNTVKDYPDTKAMTFFDDGSLKSLTYREFGDYVKNLAKGLISLGIKKGDRVAIYSDTRFEWELFDFAILTAGAIVVTVHSILNREQVEYIIKDSESKVIIVENEILLENVKDLDAKIVTIEKTNEMHMNEVLELGKHFEVDYGRTWQSVEPDDVASIVYTSGTTGEPKGAMLTHWNWRFNTISVDTIIPFYPGEKYICFLPLSHVFQRLVFFAGVSKAANAVFTTPQMFVETLRLVKPVAFVTVPRVLERANKGILENVEKQSALKKRIFYWARDVAIRCGMKMSRGESFGLKLGLQRWLADRLVYSKIRERLGLQRIRFICSSGAELAKNLAYMFNGMGIPVIEGYGMTETAAPSNLNPVERFKPGTVGPPIPGIEEAVADDGEILIRGDNVMKGYWKKPHMTEEVFTEDGWLKTGDLGDFDEDGYLIFLGRKKLIIVLDTGKNVSPIPIEEELTKNPYISDALLLGDGKPFVAALIQPNYNMLLELAKQLGVSYDKSRIKIQKGISGEDEVVGVDENLVKNSKILEFYAKIVEGANRKFAKHETVKKFRLIPEAFSIEKGELTPTLKKRKHVILKNYENYVKEIYDRTCS
jgi:long-chain acyl-CoA synthetase